MVVALMVAVVSSSVRVYDFWRVQMKMLGQGSQVLG